MYSRMNTSWTGPDFSRTGSTWLAFGSEVLVIKKMRLSSSREISEASTSRLAMILIPLVGTFAPAAIPIRARAINDFINFIEVSLFQECRGAPSELDARSYDEQVRRGLKSLRIVSQIEASERVACRGAIHEVAFDLQVPMIREIHTHGRDLVVNVIRRIT